MAEGGGWGKKGGRRRKKLNKVFACGKLSVVKRERERRTMIFLAPSDAWSARGDSAGSALLPLFVSHSRGQNDSSQGRTNIALSLSLHPPSRHSPRATRDFTHYVTTNAPYAPFLLFSFREDGGGRVAIHAIFEKAYVVLYGIQTF